MVSLEESTSAANLVDLVDGVLELAQHIVERRRDGGHGLGIEVRVEALGEVAVGGPFHRPTEGFGLRFEWWRRRLFGLLAGPLGVGAGLLDVGDEPSRSRRIRSSESPRAPGTSWSRTGASNSWEASASAGEPTVWEVELYLAERVADVADPSIRSVSVDGRGQVPFSERPGLRRESRQCAREVAADDDAQDDEPAHGDADERDQVGLICWRRA